MTRLPRRHRLTTISLALLAAPLALALGLGAPPAPARAAEDCRACDGKGVERCDACRGDGRIRCAACRGRGRVDCKTCESGLPTCPTCKDSKRRGAVWVPEKIVKDPMVRTGNGGSGAQVRKVLGKWRVRAHWEKCDTCGGDGLLSCGACAGRQRHDCGACAGTRRAPCVRCKGVAWLPDPCGRCSGSGKAGGPVAAPPIPGGLPGTPAPTPGAARGPARPTTADRREVERLQALTFGIASETRLLRLIAIQEMGASPSPEAVRALAGALGSEDSLVRRYALALLAARPRDALLARGGRPLVTRLIELLDDPADDARRNARRALSTIAREDLGDRGTDWYRWSARALKGLPDEPPPPPEMAAPAPAPAGDAAGADDHAADAPRGDRRGEGTVERTDGLRSAIGEKLHDAIEQAEKRGIDVVLAIDATSSMGASFPAVRESMGMTARLAAALIPRSRVGIVTYGDRVTGHLQPSDDLGRFMQGLINLEPQGGGAAPESVDRAIRFCDKNIKWRRGALRVTILCGDAAPRERDCYRAYAATREARARGMTTHAIVCSGGGGEVDASSFFENVVKLGGGKTLPLRDADAIFDALLAAAFSDPTHARRIAQLAREIAHHLGS